MRKALFASILALTLGGCAAYKELSPDPALSPAERGYVELKNDDENFELEQDTKYYIQFPRPAQDHFYLVLQLNAKPALRYYFTDRFDDGKPPITRIPDEAAGQDSVSVYPINTSSAVYYWVIDSVKYDITLNMRYRYVPQWRYTFENKYAEYKDILQNNTVERDVYNAIDQSYNFADMDFSGTIARVEVRTKKIRAMQNELQALEKVFPPNIASSQDTAYRNYTALKTNVDEELQFQENYTKVLEVFKKEQETRGNIGEFLRAAPEFAEFVAQRTRFPRPIIERARRDFTNRLAEATAYYDYQLRAKEDARPIAFDPPIANARKLYEACGQQPPPAFSALSDFVERYDVEASAMHQVNGRFNDIDKVFNASPPWDSESLYIDLITKANEARSMIPVSRAIRMPKYGSYACAILLDSDIRAASTRADASLSLYQSGQTFASRLNANAWSEAEGVLKQMNYNTAYEASVPVASQKEQMARQMNRAMFNRVKQATQQRVDAFVGRNQAAIDNVPELYSDSAFTPVYTLTFNPAGQAALQQQKDEIQNYIDQLKYVHFPESSIRAIYADFTRNINNRGVERARAIVQHGVNYRGDDKQIKAIVNECDPTVAKWIVKAKEYRKIYALPVSPSSNEYMFRIRLQIPSEATFPVFEINIKLPKELAEHASKQQWYKSITINNTPIKNEGRHTITSPTSENDYESQVSPVQMDKDGKNILEVRFTYPGQKVFEVSAMAQVPIIRKN